MPADDTTPFLSGSAPVGTVLSDIPNNPEHKGYGDYLARLGVLSAPRVVAILASGDLRDLLFRLVIEEPTVGAALIYGGITIGDDIQLSDSYAASSESIAETMMHGRGGSDLFLPPTDMAIVCGAVQSAEEIRSLDGIDIAKKAVYHSLYEEYLHLGALPRPESHPHYSEFMELKSDVDVVSAALRSGTLPPTEFFSDTTPSTRNYLRAIWAASALKDSPLSVAGHAYLQRLDKPLYDLLCPLRQTRSYPL